MEVRGGGQSEEKRRPFADFGFNPDAAAVTLNQSLARGQSDPSARILLTVETFKQFENLRLILRRNTLTVVGNRKQPFIAQLPRRNVNAGIVLPAIFEGIADQVLD